jgi:nucleolar MIF4G domain-containing protein 1
MVLVTNAESRKARRKEGRQDRKKKKRPHANVESAIEKDVEHAKTTKVVRVVKKRQRIEEQPPKNSNDDPYAHLDPTTAAALRKDDEEIQELEMKLGLANEKDRARLHREYSKLEGYGHDFGEFLNDLDGMVHRVTNGNDSNIHDQVFVEEDDEEVSVEDDHVSPKDKDPYRHLDDDTVAALKRDDEEIADLEQKLGLGNKKERSRLYREYTKLEGYGDDFGEFLGDLDHLVHRVAVAGPDDDDNTSDVMDSSFSDDEEMVPMKEPFEEIDEDDSILDELEAAESDECATEEEVQAVDDKRAASDDESKDGEPEPDHNVRDTYRPLNGEDIYGNKVNAQTDGQPTRKYVPPHLRKKQQDGEDESLRELRRALNNALNRLSEDTLVSVAQSIAKLYPSYPTPDVNDSLWTNVVNACVARPIVMSGMIPVYVACLAGVHLQTSDNIQLGGYLLEQVITKLWQAIAMIRSQHATMADGDPLQDDGTTKEACNLLLVLCYLYNFGVAHCALMYEIIRNLIHHFTETDIELLLLTLSHCGHALRADDPSALKEIVLLVQEKALETRKSGETTSSRVEYMISAMADLKNNKKRRQDIAFGDKTLKLRKLLGRIKSTVAANGTGRSSDACLRMTLQDIINAEEKGRWWKVGACWVGDQYTHKGDDYDDDNNNESDEAPTTEKGNAPMTEEEEMLKLASKHRMNTDMRRSIFCIIMGSADCDDAFEKLVRAGMLKNRTERDTVRVLTECCGNEKSFNPFYSHLAARICDYQPQCKFTFQLSFWDTFKQFDELKLRKAANLAKLLFHLVAVHRSLRMSVLKAIDMSPDTMPETASIFLTIFFSSIFDQFDDPADVVPLFPACRPDAAMGSVVESTTEDSGDALRESLSVFFLQTLKSSPKNKKNSKFRANFKAAVKACETDTL